MPAVLIALPTARPACADDSERTQLFRPTQKRPTWKDVERERARLSAPAETRGSSPTPVLRLAPKTPETRGSSKPAAQLPPYLRPGFVYPEPLEGGQKHARDVKACQEGLERIRAVPKNLAALLKTPEWNGARLEGVATEEEISWKRADVARAELRLARAQSEHEQKLAQLDVDEQKACLARMLSSETLRVVHPSGAVLFWRPTK